MYSGTDREGQMETRLVTLRLVARSLIGLTEAPRGRGGVYVGRVQPVIVD